jgi:hypothetical protein
MTNTFKATYRTDTKVKATYPNSNLSAYKKINIDTENQTITDDENETLPYIEITQEEWESGLGKNMVVIDGVYQEYVKQESEIIEEAKKNIEGIIRANKKAFIYANVIYKDQEFINTEIASNALKIVKDEDIEPYTWLDANDNEVIFTEDDSKQLLKIMINHRKSAYLQQAQKLRQLKIANTLEEIEAIDTSFN